MPYGALAALPDGRQERFEPGAFGDVSRADIILNRQHTRIFPIARTNGGGLILTDTAEALRMGADLSQTSEGRAAWELVRASIVRGLSIEFDALQERQDGRVRVIERALLGGVGLVDSGAYPVATVEARRSETRARLGIRLSGVIPVEKKLDCRCQTGSCNTVKIKRGAFKQALGEDREILAMAGDYGKALSSWKRGSLTLAETREGLKVESSLPDTQAARDLIAQAENVPLLVRPYFDQGASEFVEEGTTAVYDRMALRAILIGASDQAEGWPAAELVEPEARQAEPRRRRVWL